MERRKESFWRSSLNRMRRLSLKLRLLFYPRFSPVRHYYEGISAFPLHCSVNLGARCLKTTPENVLYSTCQLTFLTLPWPHCVEKKMSFRLLRVLIIIWSPSSFKSIPTRTKQPSPPISWSEEERVPPTAAGNPCPADRSPVRREREWPCADGSHRGEPFPETRG
jgi:hypothetical protein